MDNFSKVWKKIDHVVFSVVKYLCVCMLAALVLIVFYIFIGRYFIHKSPMWGEPLSLLLLTWMSIVGSSLVLRTDEHLKVTMFDDKMSKKQIFATEILSTTCILVFAVFMIGYGTLLMQQSRNNTMAGLNLPYAYMYLALPVTGVLYLLALVTQWERRLSKK